MDELFRIAGAGRQLRHEPGRVLYEAGTRPADFQFLLDGVVAQLEGPSTQRDTRSVTVTAPAALGFEGVFEGVPMRTGAKAVELAVCLSIMNDQFLALLSENTELAQGIFRMLLETHAEAAGGRVLRNVVEPPPQERLADGLQPVETVLVLGAMPLFAHANTEQLAALAGAARQISLKEGDVVFRESDPPSILLVLAGELALEPAAGGDPVAAGAGDCIGLYETIGGHETADWRGHVTRRGVALRIDREALFDVLADHIDLLQGIFSALRRRELPTVNV